MATKNSKYIYIATFKSKSNSNKKYTVKRHIVSGEISCNCMGWTFKRKGIERSCRHTRMVEARLMLQPA